jgi:YHS domain-containing protein
VIRLINAASRAGFAISGIEITGSPTSVTTAVSSGGLQQPVRDTCIVLGKAAKLFTKYKGVDVPFCTKNCQGKFEALPDSEKDFAIRDAVDRLGVAKGAKKDTPVPTKLPAQAALGNKCVILGDPGKANLARQYKGLSVPLCCRNCQETWDAMSDADKARTLASAAKK